MGAHGSVVKAVSQHHEQMDGKGYPDSLKGKDISIFAKIIFIADVFEALTSERPFKKAISPTEALKEMSKMDGKFDPKILGHFEGKS
jgi:HD-GYP domain-containing protein (c-di-GMP phosphodiesterase class II)